MKKLLLLLLPLLLTPAVASVYAVQQPNGSWRVSRYNDGDATIKTTSRDLRKIIKVDKKITKKDRSDKIYTKAGWKKFDEYEQADDAWMNAASDGISPTKSPTVAQAVATTQSLERGVVQQNPNSKRGSISITG